MKKKQVKSLTDTALEFFCELVVFIFTLTVELLTWVARKFWKRYFGIETHCTRYGGNAVQHGIKNVSTSSILNGNQQQYEHGTLLCYAGHERSC